MFAQPFAQAQIKENIKLRVPGLCEGNTPVDSPHKGPVIFPFDDIIVYSRDDIKQTGVNITHWNGNVIILTKFSPLAAPKVVKMAASSAVNDGYFIEMSCLDSYSVEEGKKFVKMNILSLEMRRHTWVEKLLIFYCLHDGTRTKVGYIWYVHIESTLWLLMAWQARHHQLWYWLTYYPRNIPV